MNINHFYLRLNNLFPTPVKSFKQDEYKGFLDLFHSEDFSSLDLFYPKKYLRILYK